MKHDETVTGAIAILDILGISSLMDKADKSDLENIRDSIIGETIKASIFAIQHVQHDFNWDENAPKLGWLFFADTLIIYLPIRKNSILNTPQKAIESLAYCCGIIFAICLYHDIALRGAISYGDFYISKDPLYIIGQPLSDAHKLEKRQQWAGVSITKKTENNIFNSEHLSNDLIYTDVPLKNKYLTLYCVNWSQYISGAHTGNNDQLPDWDACFDSTNKSVQTKKQNTIDFFEKYKLTESPSLLVDKNCNANIKDWLEHYKMYRNS